MTVVTRAYVRMTNDVKILKTVNISEILLFKPTNLNDFNKNKTYHLKNDVTDIPNLITIQFLGGK